MRVTPAEGLDGAAQVAPAMPLERSRNLALPFNGQQPVHVHPFTSLDGGGQMPINRAFSKLAQPGDFLDRLALPEEMQRFHHGFRETRAHHLRRRRERVVGEDLSRIGAQVGSDFGHENAAKLAELLFPTPLMRAKSASVCG